MRIIKQHSIIDARRFHFSNRVIYYWNNLTYEQVHSSTAGTFRSKIKHLSFDMLFFTYYQC
jgi:hypothetical protein